QEKLIDEAFDELDDAMVALVGGNQPAVAAHNNGPIANAQEPNRGPC
ncbi:hypothetical protein L195_g062518, partial [Trifolium pratense]